MNSLGGLASVSGQYRRVLVVDDEPDLAELTATFLERADETFDVETVTSADEGLDRLAEDDFDCVVSDYHMPDRNGIDFLEAVREMDPELPFILFTGRGSEAVASEAISAGVTDYIQKEPSTDGYSILANRIANAVDHYHSRQMIRRSETLLREIIDAFPHLVYVVDESGRYLLANESLAEFHETTVEAIEGERIQDVITASAAPIVSDGVEAVADSQEPKLISGVEVVDPDGHDRVFDVRLLPYDYGESDTDAVLGIATDVTERIARERAYERTTDLLDGGENIADVEGQKVDPGTGDTSCSDHL